VNDPFHLERFTRAQAPVYVTALGEIRAGRKRTHWMWFIFPQVAGLGHSDMSRHYAIGSLAEARAYLEHPVLGARLRECTEAVLAIADRTAAEVFGFPDDLKLASCMTLFAEAAGPDSLFEKVLVKWFDGRRHVPTLQLLEP
jgi:uncharacterized protein (DUF1810 family)